MKRMLVGIDSYCLHPMRLAPLKVLKWAKDHGAEGVQFSGLNPEDSEKIDEAYLKDCSSYARQNGLYIEWGGGRHIPFDTRTWKREDILPNNRKMAEQASALGTKIIRSCSGGLMRWKEQSPMTETLLEEAAKSLRAQSKMLRDHNVILAVETHFEFTTHELVRLFERCGAEPGSYLGICLDTMNLLTMLEDPVQAVRRILPWVVSTHIKDGGIVLDKDGMAAFPAEIGKGVIDLPQIIDLLASSKREIRLSIEDHGGHFSLPIFNPLFLSKFPDLSAEEFSRLLELTLKTEEKMERGSLAITEREDWPQHCEARLQRDIRSLKRLLFNTI
jgi:sugar phosphate isomerase/epimerase